MSTNLDIRELIPLLVQNKLESKEKERVLAQIGQSPELQKELDFWKGIYAIRRELPRYEFSSHLSPELLDRFAQGKTNQLSPEYSQVTSHLQSCKACAEDVELLRQTVKMIPEDDLDVSAAKSSALQSFFGTIFSSRVLAPVLSVLVIVVGVIYVLNRPGAGDIATITLQPKFEKRAFSGEGQRPEMEVAMSKNTGKVIFAFATDRVEIANYHYDINLNPKIGTPMLLSSQNIDCKETALTNKCELTVTDQSILNRLKEGGSFSLSIKEAFPAGTTIEPAEYEYFFKVSVK